MSGDSFPGQLPSVPLDPLDAADPRQLGEYRLLGRLGVGGMGVAYLADGPQGWAVVKSMWPQMRADRAFRTRLARELDAMRKAQSPRVARVLHEEINGADPWFAMEFVPGSTLKRRLEESGPLQPRELQDFAGQLATALSAVAS